jgi:glycine cleavage system H lipoate-binding protein
MAEKKTKKTGRPTVFGMANDQCVWGLAGVVKPMKCMNAFDCLGCAFDQKVQADFKDRERAAMRTAGGAGIPRQQLLMNQRKCRDMLSGRVTYKLCGHGYNCVKCPYDQMLEDTAVLPRLNAPACDHAAGFDVAREYYYHHGHTWARVEYGGRVRIGVDDFTARLLGPQDGVEMPGLGDTIEQGQPQASLVRDGNKAEPMSPVDGKVLAVNPKVTGKAGTANADPYGDGWLMVIQPTNLRKNLKNLLFGTESLAWMDDESARLTSMLSEESGYQLAATGGEVVRDIYGSVPNAKWDRLVGAFLK